MMMSQAAHNLDIEENYDNESKRNYNESNERAKKNREDHEYHVNEELKYFSDLIAMGFSEELVRPVLENCSNKPLHELVTILSDMQEVIILLLSLLSLLFF